MSRAEVCLTAGLLIGCLTSPTPGMAQSTCEDDCYNAYESCVSYCGCFADCDIQLESCLDGCTSTPSVRTGMTWTVLGQQNGYVHAGTDGQTNAYVGDTTVDQFLPILCVLVDSRAAPSDITFDFYNGWARGAVQVTPPLPATVLTSQQQGDEICADTFGIGWRLAEFHDGRYGSDFSASGGWTFWAAGQLTPGTRFWTAINDQPANPWNSAGEIPTVAMPKFTTADEPVPNQYVALFPESTPESEVESLADSLLASYGGSKLFVYRTMRGFSFTGNDAQAQAMSQDYRVEFVAQDSYGQPSQIEPWHRDRIDQRFLPLDNRTYAPRNNLDGTGVKVYVLDTGLRRTHAEFVNRAEGGWDYIGFSFGGVQDDCGGHGTAAASIAAGATVGVAPHATIVPVRVVGCNGAGLSAATMIQGVEYAIADHMNSSRAGVVVINYTFKPNPLQRWTGWRTPLERTLDTAINRGLTVVVSAGNEGDKAQKRSPSRQTSVITVSATDATDTRPWWANYGKVDLFAPGVDVRAAWRNSDNEYVLVSGSSFAAPAVAGAAALYLQEHPAASHGEVRNALQSSATPNVVINSGPGSANRLLYVGPVGTWTIWLNRDSPTGTGDWEQLADFRAAGNNVCNGAAPIGIQCQTLTGINWTLTGEVYTCTPAVGGICRNADQPDGACQDYQVRFLCP